MGGLIDLQKINESLFHQKPPPEERRQCHHAQLLMCHEVPEDSDGTNQCQRAKGPQPLSLLLDPTLRGPVSQTDHRHHTTGHTWGSCRGLFRGTQ